MALRRNVGLKAFRYRGGGPMLVWALHRIGGLAIILFVGTHVLSSFFMQQTGSDLATSINIIYESVYFQVVLYFFILFHVINGMRIIILDIFPQALEYQRESYLAGMVDFPADLWTDGVCHDPAVFTRRLVVRKGENK